MACCNWQAQRQLLRFLAPTSSHSIASWPEKRLCVFSFRGKVCWAQALHIQSLPDVRLKALERLCVAAMVEFALCYDLNWYHCIGFTAKFVSKAHAVSVHGHQTFCVLIWHNECNAKFLQALKTERARLHLRAAKEQW